MKIGLNATCFNDRPSGANQRFFGIYGELIPDTEFIVYEPVDCKVGTWFNEAPNVSVRCTPIPSEGRIRKVVSKFGYWGKAIRNEGLDLLEGFNLPLENLPKGKTLLTVHDVRRMYSDWGSVLERVAYRAIIGKTLRAADHVITVSQSMKEEILGFYPDIPISVVFNGLNASKFDHVSVSDQQAFRLKYSLPAEFVLSVGHLEKRKNYLNLIDAISLLRDQGRSCYLVIIGNDSGEGLVIKEKIEQLNLSGYVKILSGLSDLEVRCAYKLSQLFIFPSSYEGFGIPILEAMAADCPIVLSDIPVFREITQGQGAYFSHDQPESIARVINEVLSSSCEIERLIKYGNKRVQDFGFKKIAGDLADVYKSIL
ncbi:glycosyltransferase family 4 protein [Methyloprofundus sp.]|uniref:glycosyltransferase family 4 protein n=1 Tax=Methyloprofundus sp. TaxID=2020875 RepID=UPI003D149742